MLSRVLKTGQNHSAASSPVNTPAKRDNTATNDMPTTAPTTPSKRSDRTAAKENAAPAPVAGDRSSYLSFLWNQENKTGVSPGKGAARQYDEDVRMQTYKGAAPKAHDYHYNQPAQNHLAVPGGNAASRYDEDVRMRTAKAEATSKNRTLAPWEREIVASPDVKRQATVAQLCEFAFILLY